MLQQVNHHIAQLKNLVSLKYIEPTMREQCMCVLKSLLIDNRSVTVCQEYITKIEDSHEIMMTEVSHFLDLLTSTVHDYHQHLDSMHLQLTQSNQFNQRQVKEHSNIQKQLREKLQSLSEEMHIKDEQIRELSLKLDEREGLMQAKEREDNQYLSKIQIDFENQQKALEQALFMIAKRDEQIRKLEVQITSLLEEKREENMNSPINSKFTSKQSQNQPSNKGSSKKAISQNSYSLVQCSLVSSRSEGLSQFEELKIHNPSEDAQEREQLEGRPRAETLRQMLDLSLEKQYKLQYDKCDSVEPSKQNYQTNWFKNSKSKSQDKKMAWQVNHSLQLAQGQEKPSNIKEFKLPQHQQQNGQQNNPYFHYFLIASQNVKIKSKHLQLFCSVSMEKQWKNICSKRLPLHEWEREIQKYLLAQCRLIQ